jgi:hypothetical protein
MTRSRPFARHLTFLLVVSSLCGGCHRQYYRKQADNEAHSLIAEKARHIARPPNTQIQVYADRRSRMFNPFDLDFQPMPLDDPASYKYMQCVDGRRGYPMWEAAGITNTAESTDWWQFLPLDDDGVLVLNSENAVKIALLNSTDYQQEVEALYLSALTVSSERFAFDTQFFGGADTFVATERGGPTDIGIGDRGVSLNRSFATGGNLVVGLANDIVWSFSGDSSVRSTSSFLNFSLLQPLLLNAGRDKILEDLTQSERELLARVRAFERFRRTFFLNITVGARLEFTGQSAVGPVSISATSATGGGSGGFLGLLQTQLEIRNSEENIARLQENVLLQQDTLIELLTTIPDDAGTIVSQRLQVAQVRQTLVSSQQRLINQQASFQQSVDQFLRTLGLPPYICVKLDDPFLDQFELIDRQLLTRREQLSTLRANVGNMNVSILESGEFKLDPDTGLPVSQIQWTPELAQKLDTLLKELEPLAQFIADLIEQDLPVVSRDIEKLAEALPARRKQNDSLIDLYRTEQESICGLLNLSTVDESIFELDELSTLSEELREEFVKLEADLKSYRDRLEKLEMAFETLRSGEAAAADPRELAARLRDEIILASQDLVAELGDDVLALQLVQARARTESVVLPEVDISPEEAFEIARKNRRDWANARAALVDSWREIEVTADNLESSLDVIVNGGIGSNRLSPGGLSKSGQLDVGLQWDAPITRLLERNAYRSTLIRYEQAKRSYYNYEDSVWQLLRSEVRQLQANRFTFELGRELIRNSAEQIELNADQRALREARGQIVGPTAARDQIQALSALLNAQNGLLGIYVNYEVVRRGLELDLGTMELTPEGLWIDPGTLSPEVLLSLPGTTLEGMIDSPCNDCGIPYNPLPLEPEFGDSMLRVGYTDQAVESSEPVQADPESSQGYIEDLPQPIGPPDTQTQPMSDPLPDGGRRI